MKVLVTGGTGFVGSHSVKAVLEAGHEVRLLVRSPERIPAALGPLGVDPPPHVVGDVTDEAAVRRALDGCEAVLHAAAVFSYDARKNREMLEVNMRASEIVLGTAHELGLDPIVHVSSYVALLPARGTIDGNAPVGAPRPAYCRSKAASEQVARRLQDAGAPVVSTYPGMVWGPEDPYLGETALLVRDVLRGAVPLAPSGLLPVVDVRDVAAAHAAALEPGRGPRRYLLAAADLTYRDILAALRRLTGRRLPALPVPGRPAAASLLPLEAAQRVLPFRLPVDFGGPWVLTHGMPTDGSAAVRELGIEYRPVDESIRDVVRWLHQAGHVSARQAGRGARSAVPA